MDPTRNIMPHVPTAPPQSGIPSVTPGAQPVIVIMQAPTADTTKEAKKEHYRKTFPEKAILAMSIYSLVAGCLSIIIQIILICSSRYGRHFEFGGQGIWCGIFFLIAGSIGIWAAKKPSQCSIVTMMVMSIVSACMSIPHIVMDSIGVAMATGYRYNSANVGLFGFLIFLGVTAGITLIILSAFTCRAICCGSIKTNGTVMYHPSTAQTIQLGDLSHVITTGQHAMYPVSPQQESPPPTYSSDGAHQQSTLNPNTSGDDSKYKRFD